TGNPCTLPQLPRRPILAAPHQTNNLTMPVGELGTDLIESAVELDVQSVDFLIDTLDQLVERVDVGTLLAHLTLDLGLGHSGNHSGLSSSAPVMRCAPLSVRLTGAYIDAADDGPRGWKSTERRI